MDARALVLGLPATRMRETPNASANSAYARPLPAVTTPQARTVPGLRLAGCATRRRVGMVPATATAMANLLTVRRIHTARRVRRPTGVNAPQALAVSRATVYRLTPGQLALTADLVEEHTAATRR